MDARTKNGAIPDADIINLAAGMVWGGFATTWGHLSWALIQLLQHSDYLEAVMQEQWETFRQIQRYTTRCVSTSQPFRVGVAGNGTDATASHSDGAAHGEKLSAGRLPCASRVAHTHRASGCSSPPGDLFEILTLMILAGSALGARK